MTWRVQFTCMTPVLKNIFGVEKLSDVTIKDNRPKGKGFPVQKCTLQCRCPLLSILPCIHLKQIILLNKSQNPTVNLKLLHFIFNILKVFLKSVTPMLCLSLSLNGNSAYKQ